MAILGLGTDIVEIARIEAVISPFWRAPGKTRA
ncbi:4'-phosphopantetheinyl transferase [Citrobacter koseri]|uniref:4'-phosphopantetheinyl transferase n=1 Tax=Citrobacter koseri TaxID=545 RepID=A0A2X2VX55_CITKO|nr:4'-phosphopantetheinyl transferase [Citrobacter koseri]